MAKSNSNDPSEVLGLTKAIIDRKAKAMSDEITEELYAESAVSASAESNSWKLNDNGLAADDSSYKIVKYTVTGGKTYKVVSDHKFQFQNSAFVPATAPSNRLGSTYGTGTFIIKAPQSATYLIVSTLSASGASTAAVYKYVSQIEAIDSKIDDRTIYPSVNIYDPALQTENTISPHYFVNGVPYSSTQFDAAYNCTAPIPVKPNTTYTVGLVPAVTRTLYPDIVKPWNNAGSGWFAYTSENTYISGGSSNTFTTPPETAYIRFNYYKDANIVSLDVLNERCVLVEGETLPTKYVTHGDTTVKQKIEEVDSKTIKPVEYKFSNGDLLLCFGYSDSDDYVIVMNNGRANGLFDFSKLGTKPRAISLQNVETADLTTVWNSGTDMHGPFQFLATSNADGYYSSATYPGFVGGNHTLNQLGTGFETAASVYVNYYADGVPVSSGHGYASNFEIRWANDVQAYNTVKEGGGGRSCLREYHDMIFDGVTFKERITLKALEAITMSLWYGLQCVSIGTTYTHIYFVDATNRGTFSSSDNSITSGNAVTSGFVAFGDNHRIEMSIDTNIDLGKRTYYNGTSGAFVSSTKGYFNFFNQTVSMAEGAMYYLDGSYRFMPSIPGEGTPCTSISLDQNTLSFESAEETKTLTATITPASSTDAVIWSSSNENVATVNNGVVTIHGLGTATITATCGTHSATCSISQTTIKAPYALKVLDDKTPDTYMPQGASSDIVVVATTVGQKTVGQPYHNDNSVRVLNGDIHDVEAIKIPYGATVCKIKTSDNVAKQISYWYVFDTTTQITTNGVKYAKCTSKNTFFNTNTGKSVEYGQAILFRPTDAQSGTLSYVYFE